MARIYGPIIKRFSIKSVLEIGCQHQHDASIWIDIIPTITTVDWVLWDPVKSITYFNQQTNQWEKRQQQPRVNVIKNDCCNTMFTSTLNRHDLIIHNCTYSVRVPSNVDLPSLPTFEQETIQIFNNLFPLCNRAYVIENIPSKHRAIALLKLCSSKQQLSSTTIYTTPLRSIDNNFYHALIFIKADSIIDNSNTQDKSNEQQQ